MQSATRLYSSIKCHEVVLLVVAQSMYSAQYCRSEDSGMSLSRRYIDTYPPTGPRNLSARIDTFATLEENRRPLKATKMGIIMRIALAQYALDCDMKSNLGKALDLMEAASRQRAQLIAFPELCLSPFFPQFSKRDASKYALEIDDASIQQFQAACQRLKLAASPNVYFQESGRKFDASLMIGADGCICGVSKMVHIAQVPEFFEQDYYTPSDTGFQVYDMPLGKIGIVVCFDRHYPESIRTCVLRGAQLIVVPTANTMDEPRDLFECELRAAAMQNGVYIAMCNRVGKEAGVVFCGESTVVDPNGNVLFKAAETEDLSVVDLDLTSVEASRRKKPYLALRRPEFYA